MAVDTGTVYSDVRVRLDRLKGDISGVLKEFDKLGEGLGQGSEKTEKRVVNSFEKMIVKIGAFAAVAKVIRTVISTFASFEQSMANVASVAAATPAEFEKLTEAARRAGASTRFSAQDGADALYNLASAGLTATEAIEALDGVMLLAAATGSDMATASEAVTATLSQFGLAADDAGKVANVFAAAAANSQANLEKMQSALRQVGPVAGALGKSLEETTGGLQALFDAGFRGEQAGTALRGILADLANSAGPAITKLQELGVDIEKLNPSVNSLADIIGTLNDAGLEAGDIMNAFGVQAGPAMLQLLRVGKAGLEEYQEAVTGTNAAAAQAEIQMNTLRGDLDELDSAFEELTIGLGTGLAPVLRGLVQLFTNIVLAIASIPDPLKSAVLVFGAGVVAVHGLAAALGGLGVAINVALGPIALIVGGVAAIVTGVSAVIDEHKKLERAKLYEQYEKISEAAGLTGEQLEKITKMRLSTHLSGESVSVLSEVIEDITKQAAELGREFGKTTLEILKLARANEDLDATQKKRLDAAIMAEEKQQSLIDAEIEARARAEEKQQSLIEASIRYERLRNGAKELIEARARAQAEQAEREAAAIANSLRLEQERVKSVVDRREAALKKTEATVDEINRKMAAGFISQEEGAKAVTKALEAEAEELFAIGFTGQLVETTWINSAGRRVTAIAEGDRRLNEILKTLQAERLNNALAANEQERLDFANTAAFMTETQRAAAQVRADIAKKEMDAKIAAAEEEKRLIKEVEQARIDAALTVASAIIQGLDIVEIASKEKLKRDLAALDAQLQAQLEAEGVAEKTKLQRLNAEVDALEKALAEETDAEERARIQQELDEAKSAVRRTEIEEEFQRKRAKLEYKAALNAWRLNLIQAIAETAVAVIKPLAQLGVFGIPASIEAGITGGIQIATVSAAKPEAPSFQTGGIVPGRQFSGDNVQVNVNSGEGIFTRDQMEALGLMINNGGSGNKPIDLYASFYFDSVAFAKAVARNINDGKVRINIK